MSGLLAGQGVLVTAVTNRDREALAQQIAQCGGVFLTTFSPRDPPHLVITRSVRSPKYRALMLAHPHTPVVTPDWLAASVQVRPSLASKGRRSCRVLPALHACTDCVCTSFASLERSAAQQQS